MYLKERVGIKGRVILQKRRIDTARLKYLEKIDKQERETRTRIMTDEDRRIWDKAIVQEYRKSNLTMTRAIDQITSLFGRAYGFGLNTRLGDDRNSIGNMGMGILDHGGMASRSPITMHSLFPEIIQIGRGIAEPTITDASLDSAFVDTFRNTYNDKFGGYIKPSYTFKDDFICQYACIYTTDEINELDFPIYEVGLFSPEIHIGYFKIRNDEIIDFNADNPGFITSNRIWSGLNVSMIADDGVRINIITLARATTTSGVFYGQSFMTNRPGQQISVNTVAFPGPDVAKRAIVAFTPRVDSVGAGAGEWGNINGFSVGNLISRIVLPVGFVKNWNESITVLWHIYFERLS